MKSTGIEKFSLYSHFFQTLNTITEQNAYQCNESNYGFMWYRNTLQMLTLANILATLSETTLAVASSMIIT